MKKVDILQHLNREYNSLLYSSNFSKLEKSLTFLIKKSSILLDNGVDYTLRLTIKGHLNQGDLIEYLVIHQLGLNPNKKTPQSNGVDIVDGRYRYNEIKSCINPSNVGFITDFGSNYIIATKNALYKCKGDDLLKNIALTSNTKNGYRVKKAWAIASATKVIKW